MNGVDTFKSIILKIRTCSTLHLLSRERDRPVMKEEENFGWFYNSKHLIPSLTARSTSALVCFATIAILILNCWWFLLMPNRPDILISDNSTSNNSRVFATSNDSLTPSSLGLCDLARGEWVPDTSPPLYTNDTCRYIQMYLPSENCLRNRPDRGYLNWRWKPSDCELPRFNAAHFLELMHGKKLAIIGDSLGRNHMQALHCALTQVEDPLNLVFNADGKEQRWLFPSYSFTLTYIWSPFLVNYTVEEQDVYKLHLDIPERVWASQLKEYDVAIISTGYWYFRRSLYHLNNTVLGASPGFGVNAATVEVLSALRIAWGNVLKYMATEFQGVTMLRTVTVDHFEHGSWYDGGVCNRTNPFHERSVAPPLPWMSNAIKKVQVEEFEKALTLLNDSSKLKILNVTYSAHLRPDGHPGAYRIRRSDGPPNDCLHWCLPGPIDMWNQLVLQTVQLIFTR